MYAAAPALNQTANRAMSTYKMASTYQQFEFFAAPRFATENTNLSSDAKLLYGFYNTKAGQYGYLDNYTREQIKDELGFRNLKQLDRAKAECTKLGLFLSLQAGNGNANVVVLVPHPDMNLPEKELAARQIKLPPKISLMLDRDRRRKASALTSLSKLTNSALTNTSTPKEISLKDQDTEEEKKARPSAPAIFPPPESIIESDLSDQITQAVAASSTEQPIEPSPLAIPAAVPAVPSQPQPQKPPKPRKPRSKHSLELCLRFAQAEKDRKGTIEDVQTFGEACYWMGRHDKEIDRWLKRLAISEVGKARPSAPVASQPVEQQPSTQQTIPQSVADEERQALQRRLERERLRVIAFDSLSPGERAQRLQEKRAELMASEHGKTFERMRRLAPDQFQKHLIGQVQIDLVPN